MNGATRPCTVIAAKSEGQQYCEPLCRSAASGCVFCRKSLPDATAAHGTASSPIPAKSRSNGSAAGRGYRLGLPRHRPTLARGCRHPVHIARSRPKAPRQTETAPRRYFSPSPAPPATRLWDEWLPPGAQKRASTSQLGRRGLMVARRSG